MPERTWQGPKLKIPVADSFHSKTAGLESVTLLKLFP